MVRRVARSDVSWSAPHHTESRFVMSFGLLQVLHTDVCLQNVLLQNTDVLIMNNVFEFFMEPSEQVRSGNTLKYTKCALKDTQHNSEGECLIVIGCMVSQQFSLTLT